jgi:hypothetical protein
MTDSYQEKEKSKIEKKSFGIKEVHGEMIDLRKIKFP